MPNFLCTREQLKRAGSISGVDSDAQVDRLIESASRDIDTLTRRIFIPKTQTRNYRWPTRQGSNFTLWLDFDLISVTTLQTKAQNSTPTTISSSDFFLEPDNFTPPEPNVPPLAEMQGHHDEWIAACKTGAPTACNFRYAGRLIEHNMLGLVALRTGKKITWDAKNMKVVDCPEAEQYINRTYRKGWELPA